MSDSTLRAAEQCAGQGTDRHLALPLSNRYLVHRSRCRTSKTYEPTAPRWAFAFPGEDAVLHGGVVRDNHDDPPSNWSPFAVTRLTDDIYFGWPDGEDKPRFWHWCTTIDRWRGAGTRQHDLIQREPLHLEPSLLWDCCGLHGWCRNGVWTSA